MKFGYKLINELGKHGLRGYYFSYKQYKTLATINDISSVKEKIAEWGYSDVLKANDAPEIVAILKKSSNMTGSEKGCLAAVLLEPFFWLLLLFSSC